MRKLIFIGSIILLISLIGFGKQTDNVLKYVNPNIGTAHSRWFFYTPASLPFGIKFSDLMNGARIEIEKKSTVNRYENEK